MATIDFKTKSINIPRENPHREGKWLVALDIGYGGVKIMSDNKAAMFPYYARKLTGEAMSVKRDSMDIMYRDEEGTWAVGALAVSLIRPTDTEDTSASMNIRRRYHTPMFTVVLRTALALGLQNNSIANSKDKELFVQSGLPADYMSDSDLLIDAIAQHHVFEVKIGNGEWKEYDLNIDEAHVGITSQPKGTMFSSVVNDDGKFNEYQQRILNGKTLIMDIGFNTLDAVFIAKGDIGAPVTDSRFSMSAVFERTIAEIKKQYGITVNAPYLQQLLENGVVSKADRRTKEYKIYDFTNILQQMSKEICDAAVDEIMDRFDDLEDVQTLIVTGGTGEAWFDQIKESLSYLESLVIVPGNDGTNLPFSLSNVRGYYHYMYKAVKNK